MWTLVSKWSSLQVSAGALVCVSSRMLLGIPGFVYNHLSVLDQETGAGVSRCLWLWFSISLSMSWSAGCVCACVCLSG